MISQNLNRICEVLKHKNAVFLIINNATLAATAPARYVAIGPQQPSYI